MSDTRAIEVENPGLPWWLVLIEGIVVILLGVLLLMRPAATTIILIQFLGIYWLVTGIFMIISLIWDRTAWGWKLLSGILGIIAGLLIIQNPLWSTLFVPATLAIVLGVIGILIGIFQLIDAFSGGGWGSGILGVLSILLGFLLITRPVIAGLALPWVLSGLLIGGGILAIIYAFVSRTMENQLEAAEVQSFSRTSPSQVPVTSTAASIATPAAEVSSLGTAGVTAASAEVAEDDLTGNVDPNDPEEMAKFKYSLEYVEGIGPVYGEKLKAVGLVSCLDLLKAGATRKGREEIVGKSGISSKLILEWVNHVDLYRIKGIGSEYADLLEASGVDTVVELAQRNPNNLANRILEVNSEKNLVRKPPTFAQVEDWVSQAKELPRVVAY